jgi:UDP-N-acetyl-2-amino-2-deoxyglucuronate dehydrogenase
MTVRVGILGGGNISDTHARAALEIPGVEIVAMYGGNVDRTRGLVEKYGGTLYTDVDAFLSHRPLDVVLIGSPSGLHAEQARAAVAKGLHVLAEKPLDVSTAKVDELLREAEQRQVKIGVFFQNRTSPDIAWLKQLVEVGGLGEVFLASAQVKWYRPPEYYGGSRWRGTWKLDGGGALMNQGIHTVDLLLWLLGDTSRIYARTRTALHDIEVEDTVVACLEFAGGAVATLEATTAAYPGFPRRLELTGTNGTVVIEDDRATVVALHEPAAEPPPGGGGNQNASASSPTVSDVRGHRTILEDFLQAVRTGAEPLCGGREGRRSVATVEAIYRSAREGVPVSPE